MAKVRLLVVGCGETARCALTRWLGRYTVTALLRKSGRALAALGVHPAVGDLDEPRTLADLPGTADLAKHAAPPTESGLRDLRTRSLLATLGRLQGPGRMARNGGAMVPQRVVTISGNGVYSCRACADGSRPTNPLKGCAASRSADRRTKVGLGRRPRFPTVHAGAPAAALI